MKTLNILIADDHPFIIEAYNNTLNSYSEKYQMNVTNVGSCKEAYETLYQSDVMNYDIAFLDVSMPAYEEKNILSGEDVAKIIRNK